MARAFDVSSAAGLLSLAADALGEEALPPGLEYWRAFAREFLTAFCKGERAVRDSVPAPAAAALEALVAAAPAAPGSEYVSERLLGALWGEIDAHLAAHEGDLESYLKAAHPLWRLVGRVTFHLAENKRNEDFPFAFLATYTHRVSAGGALQYLPLGRELKQ